MRTTRWVPAMPSGGGKFTKTFDVPGEYYYFCIPHESLGMLGTVIVPS